MPYTNDAHKTFLAAGAIGRDLLVKSAATGVETCGAGDIPLGVTSLGATAAGDAVDVRCINTAGTVEVLTGGVVAKGDKLSAGADGTAVTQFGSAPVIGVAMAAAASGALVEMLPALFYLPPAPAPDPGVATLTAAGAIGENCLVKSTASGVAACSAGDIPVGVAQAAATAANDSIAVRYVNAPGAVDVLTGEVIAKGDNLSAGASGVVVKQSGTAPVIGVAMAAAASGATVAMLPLTYHLPVGG